MIEFFIQNHTVNNTHWSVLKVSIDIDSELYRMALIQSKKKSEFTMNPSQSGNYRSPEIKFNMQLQGVLAEIACQYYLKKVLKNNNLDLTWDVLRYDDVRTDGFKSPLNEYDIKIYNREFPSKFVLIESRSSITYNISFLEGLNQYDVIGPYSSNVKFMENSNDVYLRPLYEFNKYCSIKYSKLDFEKHFRSGNIILHLVSGCTAKELFKDGFKKSMNQGSTIYNVLPIINSTDIIKFQSKIKKLLESLK